MDNSTLIYIDGTVGVGKTSFINILHQKGFDVIPEPYFKNPILDKFYKDRQRYSFASQVFFLNKKFELIQSAQRSFNTVVDRSVYGDFIFAKMLRDNGDMSEEEFHIYKDLFNNIVQHIPTPKLVVYLDISLNEALKRIARRGRTAEQTVDRAYWADLNRNYKDTFAAYTDSPILTIPVDDLDFVHHPEDCEYICKLFFDRLASLDTSAVGAFN
jgi:deoxyadenosine/deoxycytidine kinase